MEFSYDTPLAGGGRGLSSVQQQTMDVNHPDKPHWEAGQVKVDEVGNPRMSKYGRPSSEMEKGEPSTLMDAANDYYPLPKRIAV